MSNGRFAESSVLRQLTVYGSRTEWYLNTEQSFLFALLALPVTCDVYKQYFSYHDSQRQADTSDLGHHVIPFPLLGMNTEPQR